MAKHLQLFNLNRTPTSEILTEHWHTGYSYGVKYSHQLNKNFCFYARKQLLLSAHLSHRHSVCSSVCHTGGSVKNGAS